MATIAVLLSLVGGSLYVARQLRSSSAFINMMFGIGIGVVVGYGYTELSSTDDEKGTQTELVANSNGSNTVLDMLFDTVSTPLIYDPRVVEVDTHHAFIAKQFGLPNTSVVKKFYPFAGFQDSS